MKIRLKGEKSFDVPKYLLLDVAKDPENLQKRIIYKQEIFRQIKTKEEAIQELRTQINKLQKRLKKVVKKK